MSIHTFLFGSMLTSTALADFDARNSLYFKMQTHKAERLPFLGTTQIKRTLKLVSGDLKLNNLSYFTQPTV